MVEGSDIRKKYLPRAVHDFGLKSLAKKKKG
jgi:hypothetical protein